MANAISIGVFYGSSTGNSENVAKLIQKHFEPVNVNIHDVSDVAVEKVHDYNMLIFGISTWGIGDLQDDFSDFLHQLSAQHLSGKKIALYGLGDQNTYTDSFVDALGKLFDIVKTNNQVIGRWASHGYSFKQSEALRNNEFVGLVIDEDVQPALTQGRVSKWVKQLKSELELH